MGPGGEGCEGEGVFHGAEWVFAVEYLEESDDFDRAWKYGASVWYAVSDGK